MILSENPSAFFTALDFHSCTQTPRVQGPTPSSPAFVLRKLGLFFCLFLVIVVETSSYVAEAVIKLSEPPASASKCQGGSHAWPHQVWRDLAALVAQSQACGAAAWVSSGFTCRTSGLVLSLCFVYCKVHLFSGPLWLTGFCFCSYL